MNLTIRAPTKEKEGLGDIVELNGEAHGAHPQQRPRSLAPRRHPISKTDRGCEALCGTVVL